jgi:hypothetical protein
VGPVSEGKWFEGFRDGSEGGIGGKAVESGGRVPPEGLPAMGGKRMAMNARKRSAHDIIVGVDGRTVDGKTCLCLWTL